MDGTGLSMNEKDVNIAVLQTKVDALIEKQKELTARVRANERVVAIVSAIGIGAGGIVGTTVLNVPPADATPTAGEWIQSLRDHEAEKNRTPIDETLNSALILEDDYHGCDDPTEQEELLQLQSDEDQQGSGWRHDRRDSGSRILPNQERESQDCRCGHTREEDKRQGREDPWDRRNELDEGEVERDY